ncbi:molybdate transport system permease protein [Tahibacter aquaticus]|uniref:Molybdenum transport system permease n=1 Tax=Tahibacter aquaticus TaxID=520092 RepID=A0A4R6Z9B2_9GAMM|nr:molybdate ABC transporter permease subunit [Tahibacter aquaticus]TDR48497.1 molybdate transport system permease protein [Tahibacter aquaticus]
MLSAAEIDALGISLKVALLSIVVALPFALGLGLALSRLRFPGKSVIEALLTLPLVLPPVVTGYALLVLLGRNGAVGHYLDMIGIRFAFHWSGAVVAAVVMSFPLLVISIRAGFDGVDRRLEAAAESLGAGPWRRFVTVTLPLSRRHLIAGCVLAFARAFGEFGATISFVGSIPGETRTLSIAIWELLNQPGGEGSLLRLVWVALAVGIAASFVAALLGRRAQQEAAAHD